jgi:hypothetical protein
MIRAVSFEQLEKEDKIEDINVASEDDKPEGKSICLPYQH